MHEGRKEGGRCDGRSETNNNQQGDVLMRGDGRLETQTSAGRLIEPAFYRAGGRSVVPRVSRLPNCVLSGHALAVDSISDPLLQ